jgi:hypothetical protein
MRKACVFCVGRARERLTEMVMVSTYVVSMLTSPRLLHTLVGRRGASYGTCRYIYTVQHHNRVAQSRNLLADY